MSRPNTFQQTTQLLQSQQDSGLEQKLGLYQVFQRLYDRNPALLDELLALDNISPGQIQNSALPQYIMGNRHSSDGASLTTNLLNGGSQTLYQAEQIWLLGRAPDSGLCLDDARLSRHHAAIQFLPGQGFELVDLGSTNGSFVNGEAVRHRQRLQEGDRIRLGSITIYFFEQPETIRLPQIPAEILKQLGKSPKPVTQTLFPPTDSPPQNPPSSAETMVFPRGEMIHQANPEGNSPQEDSGDRQARLLERLKHLP